MRSLPIGAVLVAAGLAAAACAAADAPRVVVGPNILVSRDGDVAHCETMIAANPKDPKNLLGGSIVMARPDGGAANKAYVSFDGGSTWEDVVIPLEMSEGSGDPQVGFGASGTAYFVGLSDGMVFYRSEDGGRTWGKPIKLGDGHDHEMLITDLTTGPYAGRVYITDETASENDTRHVAAPAGADLIGDALTVLARIDAFDLPDVWLDPGVLQFRDRADHQFRTELLVEAIGIASNALELRILGRNEQLEEELALVVVQPVRQSP